MTLFHLSRNTLLAVRAAHVMAAERKPRSQRGIHIQAFVEIDGVLNAKPMGLNLSNEVGADLRRMEDANNWKYN